MSFILECLLEGLGSCLYWCCSKSVEICCSRCRNSYQRSNQDLPPEADQQTTLNNVFETPELPTARDYANRNLVIGVG